MKRLTLLIDGIKTTFRIKDVINFTRNEREVGGTGTTCGTTYHLIKSKKTRIKMDAPLNRIIWQPASFTIESDWNEGAVELLCSRVRNDKPTYALYDVTDAFKVEFLEAI